MLLSVQELEDKPMNKPVVAKKRPASTCTSELRISVGGDVHCMPPTAASGGGAGMFSPMHGLSDSDCESEASSCYSKHHTRRQQQHQQQRRFLMNPDRLERVAEFVSQLSSPPSSSMQQQQTAASTSTGRGQQALRRVLVYSDHSMAQGSSEFRPTTTDHQEVCFSF